MADRAVRTVPGPPASLPATPQEQAAAWDNLARFRRAAAELGHTAALVVQAALATWQSHSQAITGQVQRLRAALPRHLPAGPLADAVQALERAELAIPRPPRTLPSSAADLLAAMRPIAGGLTTRSGTVALERATTAVLTVALSMWEERRTAATALADATEGLIRHTANADGHQAALNAARTAVPLTAPALPETGEAAAQEATALTGLQQLAALEATTRAIIRDAAWRHGVRGQLAGWRDREETARGQLPLTGDRREVLTQTLDEAVEQLEAARPAWWVDDADELDTADAITAFTTGIEGDAEGDSDALKFRSVIRNFRKALYGIDTASRRSAARADDVSQRVRAVLPYAGPGRYALERALNRAEVAVPKARTKQAAKRAAQRADQWRQVLSATTAELASRAAAARELANRTQELPPPGGNRSDQLAVRFDMAFTAVASLELGPMPMDSAEEIERSARDLRAAAISVELLESMNRRIITAAITEPVRQLSLRATELAVVSGRLLADAGEDSDALNGLREERGRIETLLENQPHQPERAADVVRAEVWLDDIQRALELLSSAVTQAIGTGWRTRVDAARDLVGQVRTLLAHTGGQQADLTDEFERAEAELRALGPGGSDVIADASAALRAFGPLTRFETVAGQVLARASASANQRLTAALEQAETAVPLADPAALLRLRGAMEALRTLPGLPEQPPLTASAVEAVRTRLRDVANLEQDSDAVLRAASAPLENLRLRAGEAIRLAGELQPLLPHLGNREVTAALNAAVGTLEEVRPGYLESGLFTPANVTAAALVLPEVRQAIEGLERALRDVVVAAVAGISDAVDVMTNAAELVQGLLRMPANWMRSPFRA